MATEEIHRAAKLFVDRERAGTEAEALAILETFAICVIVGDEVRTSRNAQAALLTIVNAGARTFLGGVHIVGNLLDSRVLLDIPQELTLLETIYLYGGHVASVVPAVPVVLLIGTAEAPDGSDGPVIRVSWEGWCSYVGPDDAGVRLADDEVFGPAAVHAASTALAEAFLICLGEQPMAGYRERVMSLYRPDFAQNAISQTGPDQLYLPDNLWILGLGHLGQAYLWSLLTLRYPVNARPRIVLQDDDLVSAATLSTGLLSFQRDLGQLKTRAMAAHLESVGLPCRLLERRFDEHLVLQNSEPRRLLSGLDNVETRALLDSPGFSEVIDAGLGASSENYMDFTIRTFPATSSASSIFSKGAQDGYMDLLEKKGYQQLLAKQDRCGVIEIAKKAVGVPFVGAAVGALVIAEAVRSTMRVARFYGVSGSLGTDEGRSGLMRNVTDNLPNLGSVEALRG